MNFKKKDNFLVKLFVLVLLFTTGALANTYVFYVDSPDMVESYSSVFSSMKRIMGSESYMDILKLIFLVGGFMTLFIGVVNGFGKNMKGVVNDYAKYLITGVVLLVIMFTGSSTLIIKSKTYGSFCTPDTQIIGTPIDNFPSILGAIFHFMSHSGTAMTEMVERDYTGLNSGLSISNGGYSHAIKDSLKILNTDIAKDFNSTGQNASLSLKRLLSQCIVVPYSAKGIPGEVELNKLRTNDNIFSYLEELLETAPRDVGGIMSSDYSMEYQGEIYNCGEFYTGIKDALNAFIVQNACSQNVDSSALSLVMGGSPTKSDYDKVSMQAGMIQALSSVDNDLGTGVSNSGYAVGKSKAEFIQANVANGVYMSTMLPLLQMTLRIILYAFFPFVFIIILYPGGLRVLGQYLKTILWVELWTPVAAILNMFLNEFTANSLNQTYTSGYNSMSSIDMVSSAGIMAGVAGYLYLAVPGLTWAIISGTAMMIENIAQGMATHMQKNIRTEAILVDQANMAKKQESSQRSGKNLDLAEMQHYEAVQGGRVEGSKLGTQMNAEEGIDTIADMEASKEEEEISTYKLTSSETALNGASLGKAKAVLNSVKTVTDVKAGQNISDGDSFSGLGKRHIKAKVDKQTGVQDASPTALSSNEVRKKTINTQAKDRGEIAGVDAAGGPEALQDATAKETAKNIKQTNSEFKDVAAAMKAGVTDADKNNWDRDEMSEMRKRLRANNVGPQDTGGQQAIDTFKTLTNQKERDAIAKQLGFHNKDGIVDDDARTRFNDAQERYAKKVVKINKSGDLEVGFIAKDGSTQELKITAKGLETNVGNVKMAISNKLNEAIGSDKKTFVDNPIGDPRSIQKLEIKSTADAYIANPNIKLQSIANKSLSEAASIGIQEPIVKSNNRNSENLKDFADDDDMKSLAALAGFSSGLDSDGLSIVTAKDLASFKKGQTSTIKLNIADDNMRTFTVVGKNGKIQKLQIYPRDGFEHTVEGNYVDVESDENVIIANNLKTINDPREVGFKIGKADKILMDVIAAGEGMTVERLSRAGIDSPYKATYAYNKYLPAGTDITKMTFEELEKMQREMVRRQAGRSLRSSAIGKYQFLRTTLTEYRKKMGYKKTDKFDAEAQERIAYRMLQDIGLNKYKAGKMSTGRFQNKIARKWASVQNSSGYGYYGQGTHTSSSRIRKAIRGQLSDNVVNVKSSVKIDKNAAERLSSIQKELDVMSQISGTYNLSKRIVGRLSRMRKNHYKRKMNKADEKVKEARKKVINGKHSSNLDELKAELATAEKNLKLAKYKHDSYMRMIYDTLTENKTAKKLKDAKAKDSKAKAKHNKKISALEKSKEGLSNNPDGHKKLKEIEAEARALENKENASQEKRTAKISDLEDRDLDTLEKRAKDRELNGEAVNKDEHKRIKLLKENRALQLDRHFTPVGRMISDFKTIISPTKIIKKAYKVGKKQLKYINPAHHYEVSRQKMLKKYQSESLTKAERKSLRIAIEIADDILSNFAFLGEVNKFNIVSEVTGKGRRNRKNKYNSKEMFNLEDKLLADKEKVSKQMSDILGKGEYVTDAERVKLKELTGKKIDLEKTLSKTIANFRTNTFNTDNISTKETKKSIKAEKAYIEKLNQSESNIDKKLTKFGEGVEYDKLKIQGKENVAKKIAEILKISNNEIKELRSQKAKEKDKILKKYMKDIAKETSPQGKSYREGLREESIKKINEKYKALHMSNTDNRIISIKGAMDTHLKDIKDITLAEKNSKEYNLKNNKEYKDLMNERRIINTSQVEANKRLSDLEQLKNKKTAINNITEQKTKIEEKLKSVYKEEDKKIRSAEDNIRDKKVDLDEKIKKSSELSLRKEEIERALPKNIVENFKNGGSKQLLVNASQFQKEISELKVVNKAIESENIKIDNDNKYIKTQEDIIADQKMTKAGNLRAHTLEDELTRLENQEKNIKENDKDLNKEVNKFIDTQTKRLSQNNQYYARDTEIGKELSQMKLNTEKDLDDYVKEMTQTKEALDKFELKHGLKDIKEGERYRLLLKAVKAELKESSNIITNSGEGKGSSSRLVDHEVSEMKKIVEVAEGDAKKINELSSKRIEHIEEHNKLLEKELKKELIAKGKKSDEIYESKEMRTLKVDNQNRLEMAKDIKDEQVSRQNAKDLIDQDIKNSKEISDYERHLQKEFKGVFKREEIRAISRMAVNMAETTGKGVGTLYKFTPVTLFVAVGQYGLATRTNFEKTSLGKISSAVGDTVIVEANRVGAGILYIADGAIYGANQVFGDKSYTNKEYSEHVQTIDKNMGEYIAKKQIDIDKNFYDGFGSLLGFNNKSEEFKVTKPMLKLTETENKIIDIYQNMDMTKLAKDVSSVSGAVVSSAMKGLKDSEKHGLGGTIDARKAAETTLSELTPAIKEAISDAKAIGTLKREDEDKIASIKKDDKYVDRRIDNMENRLEGLEKGSLKYKKIEKNIKNIRNKRDENLSIVNNLENKSYDMFLTPKEKYLKDVKSGKIDVKKMDPKELAKIFSEEGNKKNKNINVENKKLASLSFSELQKHYSK